MIEENAMVVAVEGDEALLQTQRRSACQACSVKQGCGKSVLSKVVGQRSSQIRVKNTLHVKVGDQVVLGINENALVQGSLLVYALPLILMLVFALLGELWAQANGWQGEWIVILAAITGFLSSAVIIRLGLNRSRLKQHIQPRMLRVVPRNNDYAVGKPDTMLAP